MQLRPFGEQDLSKSISLPYSVGWKLEEKNLFYRFVHEEESSRIMKVFFESKEDAVGRHYLPFRYEEGWLHDGCADEDVDLMDLSRSEPPPPSPP